MMTWIMPKSMFTPNSNRIRLKLIYGLSASWYAGEEVDAARFSTTELRDDIAEDSEHMPGEDG